MPATPSLPPTSPIERSPIATADGHSCAHQRFAAILKWTLVMLPLLWASSCADRADAAPPSKPRLVATIPPVAAILREVARDHAEVACLLRPGVSEHLFEARPSDMRAAEGALALVSCADDVDPWAARVPAAHRIRLFDMVPAERRLPRLCDHSHHPQSSGHGGEEWDGHFWSDPSLVRDILPALVRELTRLDPGGAETYRANASRFATDLSLLDAETSAILAPVRGRPVFTYHAGLQYLLQRYGLELSGVVESNPGQEPSAAQVAALVARMRHTHATALFTEPHLSPRAAQVLAGETGVSVHELDPIGGVPGRWTYRELIEFNAATLARALPPAVPAESAAIP